MIFAWMMLASTGIVFARYYKFIFPDFKPFKLPVWFVVHRTFMMLVPIVTITGFIVILADQDWTWLDQSIALNFAHSIIGIITLSFSVIQMLVAFIRPHPGAPKRKIFNYFHRSLGITTFLLASI